MLKRKSKAGAYAEQRYRRGLRAWRAKSRPLLAVIFGPFIVAGIVVLFVDGHQLSWYAGMVTGAGVGVWLTLRESPPRYVETWNEGAEGERKTAAALKPLERVGWSVVHDVETRYGNYDHIAVSRAGVFLLESKKLQGIVELRGGVPYLQRRLDPDAGASFDRIRPRALAAAASLKEDIEQRTGQRIWVQAIVTFWSEFPLGLADDGRCIFIHGSRLQTWLQQRPPRLSDLNAPVISAAVEEIADEEGLDDAGIGPAPSSSAAEAASN